MTKPSSCSRSSPWDREAACRRPDAIERQLGSRLKLCLAAHLNGHCHGLQVRRRRAPVDGVKKRGGVRRSYQAELNELGMLTRRSVEWSNARHHSSRLAFRAHARSLQPSTALTGAQRMHSATPPASIIQNSVRTWSASNPAGSRADCGPPQPATATVAQSAARPQRLTGCVPVPALQTTGLSPLPSRENRRPRARPSPRGTS